MLSEQLMQFGNREAELLTVVLWAYLQSGSEYEDRHSESPRALSADLCEVRPDLRNDAVLDLPEYLDLRKNK
jgi:hypothetical protein